MKINIFLRNIKDRIICFFKGNTLEDLKETSLANYFWELFQKDNKEKNTILWDNFIAEKLKKDGELLEMYIRDTITQFRKDGDIDLFLLALKHTIDAKYGMTNTSKKIDISRQSLYNFFKEGSNPKLKTFKKVLYEVGIELDFKQVNIKNWN